MEIDLNELEAQRKKLVKNLTTLVGVGIVALILLALILWNISAFKDYMLYTLIVFGVGYYFLVLKNPIKAIKDYKLQLKTLMANDIIQKLDSGISYSAQKFISREDFINTDLITTVPSTYTGQNYFHMDRGDYSVEFSEVLADRKSSSSSAGTTIFEGLFFVFNLRMPSTGHTLVVPDIGVGVLEFVTNWVQDLQMKDYTRYNIPNEKFEEKFSVYTNRSEGVPRLIDLEFQQLLLHIEETYNGKVYCSLGAPKTYLLIETTRSYFKLSVDKQATSQDQINAFHNDLAECIGIVGKMENKIKETMEGF